MGTNRDNYLNRRKPRKTKLHHLRVQFVEAKDVAEKKRILERVHKVAPSLKLEEFEAVGK